ncbi:MAG: hypothetical protein HYX42_18515 [Polaromonas sp.]|uniref:hypothetical protein n=1 Tax=Polaromonas sp. TaxID=1869339 RepID=UPI0025DEB79E|nr:hypothetical protein [Polaromonas sp.]MBI2728237.1 hypothetical protein [Polaromonas sp.]
MATTPPTEKPSLNVGNYCVSFVDLLGQRAALRGQSLLPPSNSEEEKKKLHATLRNSIGSIASLQERAETMLRASAPNPKSKLRASLSIEDQSIWDEMQKTKVTTQRWSDGLVSFACLGDEEIKCHLNNVYGLFTLAGSLCFMGLASKQPIRGAIEIAWGVELHPGEIYGAAVARAYELENYVAGYPRIVIGPEMLKFLDLHCQNQKSDAFSQLDRTLATHCKEMILVDADGHAFLHYLGQSFFNAVSHGAHADLYEKAQKFASKQFEEHQRAQNTKLAFRYLHLLQYFSAHPPPESNAIQK